MSIFFFGKKILKLSRLKSVANIFEDFIGKLVFFEPWFLLRFKVCNFGDLEFPKLFSNKALALQSNFFPIKHCVQRRRSYLCKTVLFEVVGPLGFMVP